jgi:2-polyprenyl-3-methyl-5-hydroxy-6-metoxy-1,4-benzoquinol methylase
MSSPTINDVRKFWDARPCNIRHSSATVGTLQYFEEVERRKYTVEPHIPRFAEFSRWRGKSVLEVGCGIGTDAKNFAAAGADYTGIELSSESLAITRERFEVYGLRGTFIEGNIEEVSIDPPQRALTLFTRLACSTTHRILVGLSIRFASCAVSRQRYG